MPQSDDDWQGRVCIDQPAIVLDLFGFALQKEHYRAPPCTYVKRFV